MLCLGNQAGSFITIGLLICKFIMTICPLKSAGEICYLALAWQPREGEEKRMAQRRSSWVLLHGTTIVSVLMGALLYIGFGMGRAGAASLAALDNRPPSFSAIAKKTMPVVVNISTTAQRSPRSSNDPIDEFFSRFFSDAQPRDDRTDLALIKIRRSGGNLPFARLGSSSQLEVGDWVMAIGNPFGLEHTVTAGIVSAKGRVIGAGPYDNFIQTDASINPGNSGGPLINASGEVVGVNSAIFSQSGGNVGIGFAIPIDLAKKVVDQLKKNGRVVRGWLGIRAQDVSPQLAASLGLTRNPAEMAVITEVGEGSPAAEAGIKPGDVILEFNSKPVPKSQDFPSLIADTAPGQKVTLKIIREKKEQIVPVKIGELPDEGDAIQKAETRDPEIGLRVQRITPEAARRLGLISTKGVLIVEVQPGSPADQVGLEPADVIREVNQRSVNNISDFERAVRQGRRGERILLLVQRGDNAVFFALKRKS
jgi:serine protease Do